MDGDGLPLAAEVLTRDGFKKYDEAVIGEEVLAFDGSNTVWTPLQAIYVTRVARTYNIQSKSFHMAASPNHAWAIYHINWYRQKMGREGKVARRRTTELKTNHRIIVAAPHDLKPMPSLLTPKEAALIAWMVTEGSLRILKHDSWEVDISQKKEPYRTELREQYAGTYSSEYVARDGGSVFHIKASEARLLLGKLNATPKTLKPRLPAIVTRLSHEARTAMLDTMIKAEGWFDHGRWFSQDPVYNAPVLEAFQILATLEGSRLSLGKYNTTGVFQQKLLSDTKSGNMVDVANLCISEAPGALAWCPKTIYGSWICRYGRQITITGCNTKEEKLK